MTQQYEEEVERLRDVQGSNPDKYPLRWLKWETSYKSDTGCRAPSWRESEGDYGYVIASTHDKGIVVILVEKTGICRKIKGYTVDKNGYEVLSYEKDSEDFDNIISAFSSISEHFQSMIDQVLENPPSADITPRSITVTKNELISLPKPVLVLTPPVENDETVKTETVKEDDEPIIPYPKSIQDTEYWAINAKMKSFVSNSADPENRDLIEVSTSTYLKETNGQRAILDAGAITPILGVLVVTKQQQHLPDARQFEQAVAALQILEQITISPHVRRHLATDYAVKIFLDLLQRTEVELYKPMFTIIANCCHNTKFRNIVIAQHGIDVLILLMKRNLETAEAACYVLWCLNRSEEATREMDKQHLMIEVPKFFSLGPDKVNPTFHLNLTRLLHSIAYYLPSIREQMTTHQVIFFCQGLQSSFGTLAAWSAKAFTIYEITDELQKVFLGANCEGPANLIRTLDNSAAEVILAGLECIAVLGETPKTCDEIVSKGILSRLSKLLNHEDPSIRKANLKVIGVLTRNRECANWTIKQNLIPGFIEYLHSTDPEFVIYAAKAIGACCSKDKKNLDSLMRLNGIRILWSLMKSPFSGVQAAVTRALVPFFRDPSSPTIVRTFVDGLEFLVDLLKSNDPDVQASACMAVSEVAKDRENLGVMTDLGLVELLSRLLSTKLDSVRKPLADAIGVSAYYDDNKRRFGKEGAVDPLVSYLRPPSNNDQVHASTAKALKALSEDSKNSNKLRKAGVVDNLLEMVESNDPELQMAAAVAIRNIRTNCGGGKSN